MAPEQWIIDNYTELRDSRGWSNTTLADYLDQANSPDVAEYFRNLDADPAPAQAQPDPAPDDAKPEPAPEPAPAPAEPDKKPARSRKAPAKAAAETGESAPAVPEA